MKVRITLRGTAPLLLHNIRLADPLNPYARAMKQISSKRLKTEDDYLELGHAEFVGGMYHDPELGPYLPGQNIERSIQDGGKITRSKPKVQRGLFITDDIVPLLYDGPREVEALWKDENYRSVLSVKVAQARVMRTRPLFREWSLEAEAMLDPSLLDISELRTIANTAGSMTGLGDYRPRYGRYIAEVEEL